METMTPQRVEKVAAIRAEIDAGTYETDKRLLATAALVAAAIEDESEVPDDCDS